MQNSSSDVLVFDHFLELRDLRVGTVTKIELPFPLDVTPLHSFSCPTTQGFRILRIEGEIRLDDNEDYFNYSEQDWFGFAGLVLDHDVSMGPYVVPSYSDIIGGVTYAGYPAPFPYGTNIVYHQNPQNFKRFEILESFKLFCGPALQITASRYVGGEGSPPSESDPTYNGTFTWTRPKSSWPGLGVGPIVGPNPYYPEDMPNTTLVKRYNPEPISFGIPDVHEYIKQGRAPVPQSGFSDPSSYSECVQGHVMNASFSTTDVKERWKSFGVGIVSPLEVELAGEFPTTVSAGTMEEVVVPSDFSQTGFSGVLLGEALFGYNKDLATRFPEDNPGAMPLQLSLPLVTHVENKVHTQGKIMRTYVETRLADSNRLVDKEPFFREFTIDFEDDPVSVHTVPRGSSVDHSVHLLAFMYGTSLASTEACMARLTFRVYIENLKK